MQYYEIVMVKLNKELLSLISGYLSPFSSVSTLHRSQTKILLYSSVIKSNVIFENCLKTPIKDHLLQCFQMQFIFDFQNESKRITLTQGVQTPLPRLIHTSSFSKDVFLI